MPDKQKHQDALHTAMHRCSTASQYFAMAWAKDVSGATAVNWPKDHAIIALGEAAEALGFKLVKDIPQDDPDALDVFVDRINAIALGGR